MHFVFFIFSGVETSLPSKGHVSLFSGYETYPEKRDTIRTPKKGIRYVPLLGTKYGIFLSFLARKKKEGTLIPYPLEGTRDFFEKKKSRVPSKGYGIRAKHLFLRKIRDTR